MTDPSAQNPTAFGVGAEGLSQRRDLDRIAERRCRCRAPRRSRSTRRRHRPTSRARANHLGLSGDARRREADLLRAVVVDRRPLDHRADRVAVALGVAKALQHHDPDAVAADGALGPRVERPAVAVRRQDAVLEVVVAGRLRKAHRRRRRPAPRRTRRSSSALAGQVHRDQRGRARRLDVDAGPAQVQLVGDPGRQEVLVVADQDLQRSDRSGEAGRLPNADPGRNSWCCRRRRRPGRCPPAGRSQPTPTPRRRTPGTAGAAGPSASASRGLTPKNAASNSAAPSSEVPDFT